MCVPVATPGNDARPWRDLPLHPTGAYDSTMWSLSTDSPHDRDGGTTAVPDDPTVTTAESPPRLTRRLSHTLAILFGIVAGISLVLAVIP